MHVPNELHRPMPLFADRRHAGRYLAQRLERLDGTVDLVLALAPGGVPVAYEVAHVLGVPLDVFAVGKLGLSGRPPVDVASRSVVLVDDGLATATAVRAALRVLRARLADRVVVAVPIGSYESVQSMKADADDVVCATTPSPFHDAMEAWYDDRATPSDMEIRDLLAASTS